MTLRTGVSLNSASNQYNKNLKIDHQTRDLLPSSSDLWPHTTEQLHRKSILSVASNPKPKLNRQWTWQLFRYKCVLIWLCFHVVGMPLIRCHHFNTPTVSTPVSPNPLLWRHIYTWRQDLHDLQLYLGQLNQHLMIPLQILLKYYYCNRLQLKIAVELIVQKN